MRNVAAIFLFLMGSMLSLSREPESLNIEKVLEMALENNIQYRISQQGVKQSRYKLGQSMGFLPSITLEGSKTLDEKLMTFQMPSMIPGGEPSDLELDFTLDYEFSFRIVQPVFTGGKILHSFNNARLDLKIANEQLDNSKDQLILDVKKVFYNILIFKELLTAHTEAFQIAEENLKNIRESFSLGMVSKYDLLRGELALASIKPNILSIQKLLKLSKLNLKMMIGYPEEKTIDVQGELTYSARQLELSQLIHQALTNRSEIIQLKMEQKKMKNLLKIAYAQYIPDFAIVASYSYRSNNFRFTEKNWTDYYTVNLGITFPIFNGLKRSAQIGEMKVLNRIMALNLEQMNNATRTQIENYFLSVQEEYENIQSGLKNIETAREGIRIARLNYSEGMISILELNASINELTKARVSCLQAIYNYNIALAELEKISGMTINGGNS